MPRQRERLVPIMAGMLALSTAILAVAPGVVASGSAAEGVAAPSPAAEANVTSGATRWLDQRLFFRAENPREDSGKVYQVRVVVDGSVGELLTEFVLDDRGAAVLETADFPPGAYVIVDENGRPLEVGENGVSRGPTDVANASWELFQQTLTADVSPREVVQNGTVTLEVDSNRGRYPLWVHSSRIPAEQLGRALDGSVVDTDDDGVRDAVRLTATAMGSRRMRIPNDFPPGPFELRLRVPDTNVTATVRISVREQSRVAAQFETLAVQEPRGDIASVAIRLSRTRTATLWVGSKTEGYLVRLRAVDGNGDEKVTVRMNTYYAGRDAGEAVFTTASPADAVENVTTVVSSPDGPLDAGRYPINATVDGRQTGAATLVLSKRSPAAVTVLAAPNRRVTDTLDQLRSESVRRSRIARGDKLVVRVNLSGVEGFFNSSYDLAPGSTDAEKHGVHLAITAENDSGETGAFDIGTADVLVGPEAETAYIVLNTDRSGVELGQSYRVRFVFSEDSPLVGGGETEVAEASFKIVERRVTFNHRVGPDSPIRTSLRYGTTEGTILQLSGTSPIAPGSDILVTMRSQGEQFLFKNQTAVIQEGGNWQVTFSFIKDPPQPGDEFIVKVRDGPTVISDRVTLVVRRRTATTGALRTPGRENGGFPLYAAGGVLVLLVLVVSALYRRGKREWRTDQSGENP